MFQILDGREHFYQWDVDRKIIVLDDDITEVHFCNRTDDCSLVCEVYSIEGIRLVDVPNILLQNDWRINVYAYDKNYTKHSECFKVIKRSKPTDYIYTETEIKRYGDLEERIAALEENGIPSDVDLSDYATKQEVSNATVEIMNASKGYTDTAISFCATTEYVDTKTNDLLVATKAYVNHQTEGHATQEYVDDAISTIELTPGPQGPQGEKGEQGIQGIQGEKGADGAPGKDGADGKDGAQGPKGDKGDTGAQGEQGIQGPKGDKGDKGDTGATGATGPKGDKGDAYNLTSTDKSEIAQLVIEALGGSPVSGYVDENNNVYVNGNLAAGTYTIKYEMADGSTIDVGSFTIETSTVEPEPEEPEPTYTNLANPSDANWKEGKRLNSQYAEVDATGMITTNFIEATKGDIIRVKGMRFDADNKHRVCQYANETTPSNALVANVNTDLFSTSNDITTITLTGSAVMTSPLIRICGTLTGTVDDVIITKNEEIV